MRYCWSQISYRVTRSSESATLSSLVHTLQFKQLFQDEMQILVTGMAYSFGESSKINKFKKRMIAHSISKDGARRLDDDLIFNLEEDVDTTEQQPNLLHTGSLRLRKKSPTRAKNKIARHVRKN